MFYYKVKLVSTKNDIETKWLKLLTIKLSIKCDWDKKEGRSWRNDIFCHGLSS